MNEIIKGHISFERAENLFYRKTQIFPFNAGYANVCKVREKYDECIVSITIF